MGTNSLFFAIIQDTFYTLHFALLLIITTVSQPLRLVRNLAYFDTFVPISQKLGLRQKETTHICVSFLLLAICREPLNSCYFNGHSGRKSRGTVVRHIFAAKR